MSGMIQGGWEYVIAAYAVSAVGFIGYGLWVFLRHRAASGRS